MWLDALGIGRACTEKKNLVTECMLHCSIACPWSEHPTQQKMTNRGTTNIDQPVKDCMTSL